MTYVLDAGALIAFLRNEPGASIVDALLTDINNICYVHAINLYEVYYDIVRHASQSMAEKAIQHLRSAGVVLRRDMNASLWKDAAYLKVT